jgi:hypothetical protein
MVTKRPLGASTRLASSQLPGLRVRTYMPGPHELSQLCAVTSRRARGQLAHPPTVS